MNKGNLMDTKKSDYRLDVHIFFPGGFFIFFKKLFHDVGASFFLMYHRVVFGSKLKSAVEKHNVDSKVSEVS